MPKLNTAYHAQCGAKPAEIPAIEKTMSCDLRGVRFRFAEPRKLGSRIAIKSVGGPWLVFMLFFFIYSPPFRILPFGTDKIVAAYSLIALVTKYKRELALMLAIKAIRRAISMYYWLLLISLLIDLFLASDYTGSYLAFLMLFEVIPCSLYFAAVFVRRRGCIGDMMRLLVIVGVLQSLIALALFIFPSYGYEIKHSILRFEGEDITLRVSLRAFGLTTFFLYAMPIFLGLVAAIALHLAVTQRKIYFGAVPLLLFAIAVNAKIGFLPILAYVLLTPALWFLTRQKMGAAVLMVAVVISWFSLAQLNIDVLNDFDFYPTIKWLHDGYLEVTGQKSVNTFTTLESMIHVPPASHWLLGTGSHIFLPSMSGTHLYSDIGYVLQFYYGGAVYLFALLTPLIVLLWSVIIRLRDNATRLLFISFIITVLIANYKGDFFTNNEAFKGLLVFSLVLIALLNKTSGRQKTARSNRGSMELKGNTIVARNFPGK